jgi:hypothetical protein
LKKGKKKKKKKGEWIVQKSLPSFALRTPTTSDLPHSFILSKKHSPAAMEHYNKNLEIKINLFFYVLLRMLKEFRRHKKFILRLAGRLKNTYGEKENSNQQDV